jgi:uncharacterized membrane protein YdbT with pleckstrin-like domain
MHGGSISGLTMIGTRAAVAGKREDPGMAYVEQNLMPGEGIRYRTHLHWIIYAGALLCGVSALLLLILSMDYRGQFPLAGLGGLLLVVAAGLAFSRWVIARTSEFAVTNKRVIIKRGLVRRHTLELLLSKVESIGVDQGIAGRIFGYGSIVVIGTGGTRETFDNISQPLEFRKQVQAYVAG